MAPTKSTRAVSKQQTAPNAVNNVLQMTRKGIVTRRSAQQNIHDQHMDIMQTRGKRKAEHSPALNEKVKRSALGNLTNNVKVMAITSTLHLDEDAKQQQQQQQQHQQHITKKKENIGGTQVQVQVLKDAQNIIGGGSGLGPVTRQQQNKITTRATARNAKNNAKVLEEQINKSVTTGKGIGTGTGQGQGQAAVAAVAVVTAVAPTKQKKVDAVPALPGLPQACIVTKAQHKTVRRISNEFNKTEESLYMSALEDISSCESMRLSGNFEAAKRRSALLQEKMKTGGVLKVEMTMVKPPSQTVEIPKGVEDFDKVNWNDPFQVSHYAFDIFNYLKERETQFPIENYMENQVHLSAWMRSLLVDWMVEVQETFELNHETLYLAVKIVDIFLCRVVVNKDNLQLLGAAALFIACKYDERTPPLIEDFLYICDGAYKHDELIKMEMTTLRTINYDLGIPLSYRFLRRYARCAKVPMPTLTLARYILELSLMDYDTIRFSDSRLACAALFMALRLHGEEKAWTPTLEYYSGYKIADFAEVVPVLNAGMHRKPKSNIKTIRNKYSHKIFYEVAKVTFMSTNELFENNIDLNTHICGGTKENSKR